MPRPSKTGERGLLKGTDGRYRIDFRWRELATGEWRRYKEALPASTKAVAAKARVVQVRNLALAGGWKPNQEEPKLLSEALVDYIAWCETNRPAGLKKRRKACDRLLVGIGDRKVETMGELDAERFKKWRKETTVKKGRKETTGVGPGTINRDLELLGHAFGLFIKWGLISRERADAIRHVPHLKEPPGRVRYLSEEEEARLWKELPRSIVPIVEAALLTGMRQAEVVLLRKSSVDLRSRVITLTVTKSNKVRRVDINRALAAILEKAIGASKTEFVFTNSRGQPYTTDGLRCMFRRACAKAKLVDFHFHDLRHTVATRLRQEGHGLDVIQRVLGHATLAMTQRYAHLGNDLVKKAMEKLSVRSGGARAEATVTPLQEAK